MTNRLAFAWASIVDDRDFHRLILQFLVRHLSRKNIVPFIKWGNLFISWQSIARNTTEILADVITGCHTTDGACHQLTQNPKTSL